MTLEKVSLLTELRYFVSAGGFTAVKTLFEVDLSWYHKLSYNVDLWPA